MIDAKTLLDDLTKALSQLESALATQIDSDLLKAGCIQYFEFSFEIAWKTVKSFVAGQGLPECYSPKSCIKEAFKLGWINNEEIWLDMLESRNQMAHTYHAQDALTVFDSLPTYLKELQSLHSTLSRVE